MLSAAGFANMRRVISGGKFMRGKRHGIKHAAGAGVFVRVALLVGHCVFRCADKVLCGTDDANHREKTNGNNKRSFAVMSVDENAVDVRGNGFGKIVGTATAIAAVRLDLDHASVQNDGVYDLCHRGGNILLAAAKLGNSAEIGRVGIAAENADIAFTAVKNDVLFHHSNAVKILRPSGAYASLKGQLDIKANGYGIKTAIKTDGVDPHKRPRDARILDANGRSMFYDFIPDIGKENANVLEAISVTAGIENAVGLDTDHIPLPRSCCGRRTARKSVFGHKISILQYSIREGTLTSLLYHSMPKNRI